MKALFGMAVALALISTFDSAVNSASAQRYLYPYGPRMRIAPPTDINPISPRWAYPFECVIDDGYNRYHPCDSSGGGGD